MVDKVIHLQNASGEATAVFQYTFFKSFHRKKIFIKM